MSCLNGCFGRVARSLRREAQISPRWVSASLTRPQQVVVSCVDNRPCRDRAPRGLLCILVVRSVGNHAERGVEPKSSLLLLAKNIEIRNDSKDYRAFDPNISKPLTFKANIPNHRLSSANQPLGAQSTCCEIEIQTLWQGFINSHSDFSIKYLCGRFPNVFASEAQNGERRVPFGTVLKSGVSTLPFDAKPHTGALGAHQGIYLPASVVGLPPDNAQGSEADQSNKSSDSDVSDIPAIGRLRDYLHRINIWRRGALMNLCFGLGWWLCGKMAYSRRVGWFIAFSALGLSAFCCWAAILWDLLLG